MMESVEHEFLRSLGISAMPRSPHSSDSPKLTASQATHEPLVTWPRVSASCDYRSAARFEEELEIELAVGKIGDSSIHYEFSFCRNGDSIANGVLVAVCCHLESGVLKKISIPQELRHKLTDSQQ